MCHRPQIGKERPVANLLIVPLANIKEHSAQVELLIELRNEYVRADHTIRVLSFVPPDCVYQPLELVLRARHPDEINLFAFDLFPPVDDVFEYAGEWRHTNACTY